MSKIMEMILSRLGERDLVTIEINRLIKDVSNVVYQERSFESDGLKQTLKVLGWEEQILDYRTLELILLFLGDEKGFEINRLPPLNFSSIDMCTGVDISRIGKDELL